MLRKTMFALLIAAACMLVASQVYAFPMSGVSNFAVTTPGTAWTSTVTWELYAPGDTNSHLAADSNWHYFYYITNTTTSGSTSLKTFTIGNPATATIVSVGSIDRGAGTPAPSLALDQGDSIAYYFFGNPIAPGQATDWLYYTSPVAPQWVQGGLVNGGITDHQALPGPAPEPASVAMLGLGLIGMASRTIRKKFTA